MENESQDVLEEYTKEVQVEASKGLRLANYLIDIFAYYIILVIIFSTIIVITGNQDFLERLAGNPSIADRLLALFFYGLFMSFIEGLTKGRSLGKLITRTRAIYEDGSAVSWESAFKRGLSRMVPFEPFSALAGRPWHDTWTRTRVVRITKFKS